ncbi:MAG: orotidine 5-phosphate decarboxylase [Sulfitobacter sp.]|jgi:hypothetical protein|nr:orotidine 5-phosphate decarboxylase [Sulfitobacter sp.]
MYTCPIQLTDVRYDASSRSFQALVTVHDNSTIRKYACAISAPITMSFHQAAKGLTKQAIRLHQAKGGLYSSATTTPAQHRAGRQRFDPRRWLEGVITRPDRSVA